MLGLTVGNNELDYIVNKGIMVNILASVLTIVFVFVLVHFSKAALERTKDEDISVSKNPPPTPSASHLRKLGACL